MMAPAPIHRRFPPVPQTPGAARRFVADNLGSEHGSIEDDVLLLTSELVTNAMLHGKSEITVDLERDLVHVRVEVGDCSPERPRVNATTDLIESGRGLHLLEAIADRWGTDADAATGGKRVWFEINAHRA